MYHITDSLSNRLFSKVYSLFENLVICTHVGQSYTFKIICMKFATCSLFSSLRVDLPNHGTIYRPVIRNISVELTFYST